ncbi:lyase family protein [Breoghania sp.]|uniref:lyase family protein n=1 Tax=Breoghania sp. TaxID=2065378 RepID=UPI00261ECE29|nr:lyase family protein [Breoghania sp.]MDJ0932004.1 lyase family protein [Breoghania sp.]
MGGVGAIDSQVLDGLFSTAPMRAIWNDTARVQAMLDFESALARVQSRLGVVPHGVGDAIGEKARVDLYDFGEIGEKVPLGGNVAIPLVKALTAKVEGEAAGYVHWGATSQDVIDTGMMLQARNGLRLLKKDLLRLGEAAAVLIDCHRKTTMVGRGFLQQGIPSVFGLKTATWLDSVSRMIARIDGVIDAFACAAIWRCGRHARLAGGARGAGSR